MNLPRNLKRNEHQKEDCQHVHNEDLTMVYHPRFGSYVNFNELLHKSAILKVYQAINAEKGRNLEGMTQ